VGGLLEALQEGQGVLAGGLLEGQALEGVERLLGCPAAGQSRAGGAQSQELAVDFVGQLREFVGAERVGH
jgi:hypothetical protein